MRAANNSLRQTPLFLRCQARSIHQVGLLRLSTPATQQLRRSTLLELYKPLLSQNRSFLSYSGITRNQLAAAEESANRNAGNASSQNAFYHLLLKAKLPKIIIERHQTGHFASDTTTLEYVAKANASVGGGAATTTIAGSDSSSSVGAAAVNAASRGAKGEPIHVIVTESSFSYVFKWVKFLLWYAVIVYLSFVVVTVVIESLSSFRRGPGGAKGDAEVKPEKQTARFSDVHGCDEAKEELQEVVEFLRAPENFSDLGAKLPKGVLLVGPPGTGKTLLARAVAGEAGVPFFYMSGSEFDEIFVGVGAKRIRELFAAAKSKSPAIIFIDELDAIGGKRNPRDPAYAKQTLNQLLTEMDGFSTDTKIVLIGATNLPDILDKALTRPGRFDRHINVELPDVRGRQAILRHHAKKVKLAPDADIDSVAARTAGRSGADLENILNFAALRASKARATVISGADLEWAYDRMTMGSEKKSRVITAKEKEMTAYHEAGHALVQLFDKESSSRLYKVTILPKGPSLGHTAFVPQEDKYSYTMSDFMSMIRVSLGGKMAEEMQYGTERVTSGVSADIENATNIGFSMVTSYGMSSLLGPVEYRNRYENLSSETKSMIEAEVQRTLKESYEEVRKMLTEKRKELDLLAQALVKYETLDRAEVEKVIRGESLPDRPVVPPGPMVIPAGVEVPHPPGLDGVTQTNEPAGPSASEA
jgi:ATP-dependent metalloprotease